MTDDVIQVGDHVKIAPEGVYYNGKQISPVIKNLTWVVINVAKDRILLGSSTDGHYYMGAPISIRYLKKTLD